MKTPAEFTADIERVSHAYRAMMEGIRRDGLIDHDEAILGREYAEEHRTWLQNAKRDVQAAVQRVRADHRAQMRDLRDRYRVVPTGEANALRDAQLDAVQPYQELLLQLDRMILDTKLERDAFRAAADALRYDPMKRIEVQPIEADVEETSLTDSLSTNHSALAEELRDCVDRWRTLLDETERRLAANEQPSQAAHLRGVKKALELAISDVMVVLTMEAMEGR